MTGNIAAGLQGSRNTVARLFPCVVIVALSVCSIDACGSYATQLDPPAPHMGDVTTLTLSTVSPSYVYDFDVWPYAEFAGSDVTVNYLCEEFPGGDPARSTASIGALAAGHHTIHVWCWYDEVMMFFHVEVATLQIDVPAAEPLSVPATNVRILAAQAIALTMLSYLARRRKPRRVARQASA